MASSDGTDPIVPMPLDVRTLAMNIMAILAVFVSLLFWGWLWGAWGLLLAIPIIGILHTEGYFRAREGHASADGITRRRREPAL
jgi:hypothetical protein